MTQAQQAGSVRRIAMIGNFPPRLCGIATFTADTRAALVAAYPDIPVDIYAMNDRGEGYEYPQDVVCTIAQGELEEYRAAARRINDSGADVLVVQHEYGIFGGNAGNLLLRLLDRVDLPVVVVLHTVLENPDVDQRTVLDALARRASRLIVMAQKGRDILARVHGLSPDRIAVVPHGVPDRPFKTTAAMKARFGLSGHTVLLTFGLLSPNKGIETMIRALPGIVARQPDALYVVLGATHPHLVAREGEAYRESLAALAEELGVAQHLRFIDGFVAQDELLDHLEAADVYVTPYLNEAQITSGTLSYAVAMGKPVVSTPYWHAVELLGDGTGLLVPFGDSVGFAQTIGDLLAHRAKLDTYRRRAWDAGREMTWEKLAHAYMTIFRDAVARRPVRIAPRQHRPSLIAPDMGGVERLTDGCGMIQHSIFAVPDRNHGYCVDDNCRALMLMHRLDGEQAGRADALATIYAAFVQHAWNGTAGRFRNFMAFDRSWLEEVGSEDSFGRSLWAIGDTAAKARRPELRRWALHLFDQVAPHSLALTHPRSWAFSLFGADALLEEHAGHTLALSLVRDFGERLHALYRNNREDGWRWFEHWLSYDNARLAEALIRAGHRLDRPDMVADGIEALDWLDGVQRNDAGQFRAVGTESFGRRQDVSLPWDQQPLEAWATIDAALTAHEATGDARWLDTAMTAYAWYVGENDLGLPMATFGDGGCYDGLMSDRANLNQGAESVLAFQFACCAAAKITARVSAEPLRESAAG
ncbi:glycosyltransferase family 4 protein [Sphingomonas jatrophae]|uniref:Glycosyltransferase involved in cell wall bisynthesis n=1 Tax=Sphingomonas jatrophae TaxID=1166337 RepID=A0A1I6JN03_9SPHN|nr:glycosyltransferase family 4 protein [Sphingomonas jatrophae]SFR80334.1 Glycosyltransferase involved in cell wall bisynthesis [Sphingomonas jatrophae]